MMEGRRREVGRRDEGRKVRSSIRRLVMCETKVLMVLKLLSELKMILPRFNNGELFFQFLADSLFTFTIYTILHDL